MTLTEVPAGCGADRWEFVEERDALPPPERPGCWTGWCARHSGIVVHDAPGMSPASSAAAVCARHLAPFAAQNHLSDSRSDEQCDVGRRAIPVSLPVNWRLSYLKVSRPSSPHRRLAAMPSTRGALLREGGGKVGFAPPRGRRSSAGW